MRFSVIVPLFNRPDEIAELLESLTKQSYTDFEVLVVEDGSDQDARGIVEGFQSQLDIHYFWKENTRQGFTRNFGFERAKGDWFVVFDSDCLIPEAYFECVAAHLDAHPEVEVYGGPDAAHGSFYCPTEGHQPHDDFAFDHRGNSRGKAQRGHVSSPIVQHGHFKEGLGGQWRVQNQCEGGGH